VARQGARVVGEPGEGTASRIWREAVEKERDRGAPPEWAPDVWIEDPDDDAPTGDAPARAADARSFTTGSSSTGSSRARTGRTADTGVATVHSTPARRPPRLPAPVKDELGRANRRLAPKLEARMGEAVRAYERDRYQDARRILRTLVEAAPDAAAVRELYGLTLYRLSKWAEALKELEAFHSLSGSHDQHPVLMDSNRALRRWGAVEELWADLRAASPGAEVVAEGRIVAAGALADRGRLAEAIQVLERAPSDIKRPKLHHLRTWYALADAYEKAGEIPRARALFTTVLRHDADFADVGERLAGLG
jgi:thioredoxin-like negative regulator of GroEL